MGLRSWSFFALLRFDGWKGGLAVIFLSWFAYYIYLTAGLISFAIPRNTSQRPMLALITRSGESDMTFEPAVHKETLKWTKANTYIAAGILISTILFALIGFWFYKR